MRKPLPVGTTKMFSGLVWAPKSFEQAANMFLNVSVGVFLWVTYWPAALLYTIGVVIITLVAKGRGVPTRRVVVPQVVVNQVKTLDNTWKVLTELNSDAGEPITATLDASIDERDRILLDCEHKNIDLETTLLQLQVLERFYQRTEATLTRDGANTQGSSILKDFDTRH